MFCWIELDASNLIHNYRLLGRLATPAAVIPIIKSNAYGHGLPEIYHILAREQPTLLGVNYLFEAELLRTHGYAGRILCVGPVATESLAPAQRAQVEIFVGSKEILVHWLNMDAKPNIHIKFDTGMSRQGFHPQEAADVASALLPHLPFIKGVCSHFANVEDVLEQEYALHQLASFKQARDTMRSLGITVPAHIASSASALILKDSQFDHVRTGISLYGLWPARATRLSFSKLFNNVEPLRPVLSWRAKITSIQNVAKDCYIGYGCTFKAIKNMQIAILPVGYYEGYPRLAGEHASHVLIHGTRCPVVGRVCMNMMMADVSHLFHPKAGDVVTLIGKDGTEEIEAELFAGWAGTIHYEALTRLNPSIPRITVN